MPAGPPPVMQQRVRRVSGMAVILNTIYESSALEWPARADARACIAKGEVQKVKAVTLVML